MGFYKDQLIEQMQEEREDLEATLNEIEMSRSQNMLHIKLHLD